MFEMYRLELERIGGKIIGRCEINHRLIVSRPKKTLDKVIDEILHVAELLDEPVHDDPVFEVVWIKEEVTTKGCIVERANAGYMSSEMNDVGYLEMTSPGWRSWRYDHNSDN